MGSDDPLRVAVLGCGQIARAVHLLILTQMAQVRVCAIVDCDERALDEAGILAPNARRSSSFEEELSNGALDAVIICLPNVYHAASAIAAMRHGLHVYIEKPIATSVAEAQEVVQAWRETGVTCMVGFNYRFDARYERLREQIAAGAIGSVSHVRSTFTMTRYTLPVWKRTVASGGGVLRDLAVHEIDMVYFVLGEEIVEVSAQITSRNSEDDTAALQMSTVNGVSVHLFSTFDAIDDASIEVWGEEGKLVIQRYGSLRVEHQSTGAQGPMRRLTGMLPTPAGLRWAMRKRYAPCHVPSYEEALRRFVRAVRRGEQTWPDAEDGVRALAVIEAAETSSKTGSAARVEIVGDSSMCTDQRDGTK